MPTTPVNTASEVIPRRLIESVAHVPTLEHAKRYWQDVRRSHVRNLIHTYANDNSPYKETRAAEDQLVDVQHLAFHQHSAG